MQQNFTTDLLVKHLYNETNDTESKLVEDALKSNEQLQQEYTHMQTAKFALDETDGTEPNKSVITQILNYSKNSATELA